MREFPFQYLRVTKAEFIERDSLVIELYEDTSLSPPPEDPDELEDYPVSTTLEIFRLLLDQEKPISELCNSVMNYRNIGSPYPDDLPEGSMYTYHYHSVVHLRELHFGEWSSDHSIQMKLICSMECWQNGEFDDHEFQISGDFIIVE